MKANSTKIILFVSVILFIGAGLFFRLNMFSSYLIHVDSYKYLVQADSFQSDVSLNYAKQNLDIQSKWGLPLFIQAENSIFQFRGEDLVNLFRWNNIILSLLCALILFAFIKNKVKFFAIPLFLSPIFFDLSSYVVNEYLNLFLIITLFVSLQNVFNIKKILNRSVLAILIGSILAFLPFVRPESIVFSLLVPVFLFVKDKKIFMISVISEFVIAGGLIGFISLHLNKISINYPSIFVIILVLAEIIGLYFLLKSKVQLLRKLSIYTISLLLPALYFLSQTYKNAISQDAPLYFFIIILFAVVSYLLTNKGRKISNQTVLFSILLLSLITIFYFFNSGIDRYIITIFGMAILTLILAFENMRFKIFLPRKYLYMGGVCIVLILTAFSIIHINVYRPREQDYQQYVVKSVNLDMSKRVYMSGFLYTPYLFYKNTITIIADNMKIQDISKNSYIIVEESLRITNLGLFNDIITSDQDFTLVRSYKSPYNFTYSGGESHEGKIYIYYRQN